jgi:putative addiction module component (TIGR02574 family)
MSTAQLAAAVKALPPEEKNQLLEIIAADLVDSAPPGVHEAQVDEMLRRRQEWLDGKTQLVPGEQVMREMREKLERPLK